jgi:ATP-dependent DNA ligase
VLRLPEPMLARAGRIPTGRGWTFEPKLDRFRCLICTHAGYRARSRRGWNMTPLLPKLAHALRPTCSSTATSSRSTAPHPNIGEARATRA